MIDGVVVMVVGVTVVFAFLGLLVLIMQISALFSEQKSRWQLPPLRPGKPVAEIRNHRKGTFDRRVGG